MSDSDDEDLKRAIAMSLGESSPEPISTEKTPAVIDLISDDDDNDDLDAPVFSRKIATSNQKSLAASKLAHLSQEHLKESKMGLEGCQSTALSFKTEPSSLTGASTATNLSVPNSTLRGLDRKKMEEERLARAAARKKRLEGDRTIQVLESNKRRASDSHPQGDTKRRAMDQLSDFPLSLSDRTIPVHETALASLATPPIVKPTIINTTSKFEAGKPRIRSQNSEVLSFKEQQQKVGESGMQYPDGVVKKTWVYGCPRQGDDIKIEEVLQKDDLDFAVLSAYQVDPEWVMSKLGPKTKVVMVLQAKTEQEKQNIQEGADSNLRFCFPSMEGQINCMHSKLQLLSHPTHLRVVVPSANLMPYDWGETGVMENICFLIDLPRLPGGELTELADLTIFGSELLYFLQEMGLDPSLIKSLRKFDFSRTAHLAFVHTIGGSHSSSAWKRTGYCGLGTAVRKLGLQTEEALNIDFVTASIGNITEDFMKCMFLAAKGDDGTTEFGWRLDKASSKNGIEMVTEQEKKLSDEVKSSCCIYFPTRDTVVRSKGGIGCGGTICLQPKWYDAPTFPRSLLRDSRSIRGGILMHDKITYVRSKSPSGKAWAYVGSANLSESAWGRLVKDRRTKQCKLNCRNWECGVLFPVPPILRSQAPATDSSNRGEMGMDVFHGHVPVPMCVPGQEYEGRRPWFWLEE